MPVAFATSIILPRNSSVHPVTTSINTAPLRQVPVCKKGRRQNTRRSKPRGNRIPKSGDPTLLREFEEDIKGPLEPARGRTRKDAPVVAGMRVPKFRMPKTREATLALLIQGAWIGIGLLAGAFVLVHFVVVRDFFPSGQ